MFNTYIDLCVCVCVCVSSYIIISVHKPNLSMTDFIDGEKKIFIEYRDINYFMNNRKTKITYEKILIIFFSFY